MMWASEPNGIGEGGATTNTCACIYLHAAYLQPPILHVCASLNAHIFIMCAHVCMSTHVNIACHFRKSNYHSIYVALMCKSNNLHILKTSWFHIA